jgi:hypothetical protein
VEPEEWPVIAAGAPVCGEGHTPEEVRRQVEATLRRVMAAGQVAHAMWRLVLADGSYRHAVWSESGHGQGQDLLPRLAGHAARAVIDASSRRGVPGVYLAAVRAAADVVGDRDLAALVLADLASLHLRLGYAEDCRRLVELAAAGAQLSEYAQRVVVLVRDWAASFAQLNGNANHDGETSPDGHER